MPFYSVRVVQSPHAPEVYSRVMTVKLLTSGVVLGLAPQFELS